MKILEFLLFFIVFTATAGEENVEEFSNTPVVFWHGMGMKVRPI